MFKWRSKVWLCHQVQRQACLKRGSLRIWTHLPSNTCHNLTQPSLFLASEYSLCSLASLSCRRYSFHTVCLALFCLHRRRIFWWFICRLHASVHLHWSGVLRCWGYPTGSTQGPFVFQQESFCPSKTFLPLWKLVCALSCNASLFAWKLWIQSSWED